MAGAGFKTFNTGDVLTASDVNTYLMQQTVMVFADSTARTTALGANVAEGMLSYLKDTNTTAYYDGSAWQTLSTGGDITSVVAGTGLTGGGTSGDVTVSLDLTAANVYTAAQTATRYIVTGTTIPTNGMYLPTANNLGFATNSTSRLTIGTTSLTSTLGATYLGQGVSGSAVLELGQGRTADGSTYIDMMGDTTYTDYGLRIIRNSGANGGSQLVSRGTGGFSISTQDAAAVAFQTQLTTRMTISSGGRVGIGSVITTTYQARITNVQGTGDITLATTNYAAQTADSISVQNSAASTIWGVTADGFMKYSSGNTATTVGAAGAASALPANPTGYLKIDIGGTEYKVPYYAA